MKINLFLITIMFLPVVVLAKTLDEYAKYSQSNPMWVNSTCGFIEPVPSYDANKLLINAFKSISLEEGKPEKWEVIEHNSYDIHNGSYYLVRFVAFNREHIFVFVNNKTNGKWCVRS